MNYLSEILKNNNFDEQLKKLSLKYKNKKIVFYGGGHFFEAIQENYDLSGLNIIAVSDIKYENYDKPALNIDTGLNVISPEFIHTLEPDIVLISLLNDFVAERFFVNTLFKKTKKRFKFSPIFQLKLSEKVRKEWKKYF